MTEQTDSFVQEGVGLYPQALLAMTVFSNWVLDICCEAMKRHTHDLGEALHFHLQPARVVPHVNPSLTSRDADGKWACLGAKIVRPDSAPCTVWEYAFWKDRSFTANVSIEFESRAVAKEVWTRVSRLEHSNFGLVDDEREIALCREIGNAEQNRLGIVLDELNREWVEAWTEIGGLLQFFPRR